MAYPAGMTTRTISLGPALTLEDGTPLSISCTVKASADGVWSATGTSLRSVSRLIPASALGAEPSLTLPVTDQVGWIRNGDPIDVTDGKQTHTYTVTVMYSDADGKAVSAATIGPFALPEDDGSPLDIDKLIQTATVEGVTLAIPDAWGQLVAAAEAAAADAQASADAIPTTVDLAVEQAVETHTPGISLGANKRESNFTTTNTVNTSTSGNITELTKTIVGQGRPVRLTFHCPGVYHSVANTKVSVALIRDGNLTGSDTQTGTAASTSTTVGDSLTIIQETSPLVAGTSYTFTVRVWAGAAGTATLVGASFCATKLMLTSA